jgi:glycosyltransferase involved in cell wall biosynthesis
VATHAINIRNDLDLRCVPGLRRLIKHQQYDIVHLHTKRAHALSLWLPRYRGGPKYLVTRRMDYPERRNAYTHYLYNQRVDGVVAVSRAVQNSLIKAGVDAHKIRQIYSGVDAEKFLRLPAKNIGSRKIIVVGCLAVLERRKGHRFLLQSAALLKSRGLTLKYRMAGAGSLRADLEEMANQLGLRDEVSFTGFNADPAEFLADIDILVLPSLYEGFGIASLEGMAAAKPVVVTSVGGLTETVVDGVTGLLVPSQDSQALAEAIAKLVREPSLAAEMGLRGRERVRQNFSLTHMAQQNEAFYYDLLDGRL